MNKGIILATAVIVGLLIVVYVFEPFGMGEREYGRNLSDLMSDFDNIRFQSYEDGDEVNITDKVKDATYHKDSNETEVLFTSYNRTVFFKGDLLTTIGGGSSTWFILPGTHLRFQVHIGERSGGIHYIEEFYNPTQSRQDLGVIE